jgi:hypothetical protein
MSGVLGPALCLCHYKAVKRARILVPLAALIAALLVTTLLLTQADHSSDKVKSRSRESAGAAAASNPLGSVGRRSGLTWNSGVYPTGLADGNYAQRVASFERYRGRKVDVALGTLPSQTWADILNGYTFNAYRDFEGAAVISVPMLPHGASMSAGARGEYNDYWRQFGQMMVDRQRGASVLRVGWEFTGDWAPWSAFDPPVWKDYWRHIVQAVRSTNPAALFDWNGTANASPCGHDPFSELWPGDEYVDIVGVDLYDSGPSRSVGANQFNAVSRGPLGIDRWLDFAKSHGKRLSLPEWGLSGGSDGGGDNADWMTHMVTWIKSIAPDMAYEAYFNEQEPYIKNSLADPTQMPNAATSYRKGLKSA